jgi:hypothetical protein
MLKFFLLSIFFVQLSHAVPVDWKGSLGYSTRIIKDVRRTGDNCTVVDGSQCINPEEENARFQDMTLKLNPNMIVNDGVTIKGELTTGGRRGAKLGAASSLDAKGGSHYAQTTSSTLNVNQLYAELYADTALYRVGRFSKHWGLGALINSGDKAFDQFFSGYEGIEAQLKLGNFHMTPMWAKLHTSDQPNGKYDAYETSVSALYDNSNRNLQVGMYYSVKEIESNDTLYGTGTQSINLVDIYIAKQWDNFSIGMEVPMLTGKVNNYYGTGDADFDTNAYIVEMDYQMNAKWKLGLNTGIIKGDDGTTNSFEGMYLHPNYKFSEIMYQYNYHGFTDSTFDIYNSSMVNSTYAQLYAHYSTGEWTWRMSTLWAKANEVAETGKEFYDHERKAIATAVADQSNEMGYEFDLAFDYQWNPNVVFTGSLGYHIVGDYYAFDNDASGELSTSNVMSTGMQLSISF